MRPAPSLGSSGSNARVTLEHADELRVDIEEPLVFGPGDLTAGPHAVARAVHEDVHPPELSRTVATARSTEAVSRTSVGTTTTSPSTPAARIFLGDAIQPLA